MGSRKSVQVCCPLRADPKDNSDFLRFFTEYGTEYDEIDYGYSGKLYLEIIPQSFSIELKKNICLNQIRFFEGSDENIQKKIKISRSFWIATIRRNVFKCR